MPQPGLTGSLFNVNTSSSLNPNNNGFFGMLSDDNTPASLLATSTFRFIRASSDPALTTSRKQLENFLASHAPIFVHDKFCASSPTSVKSYLTSTFLFQPPDATKSFSPTPALPAPDDLLSKLNTADRDPLNW